MAIAATLGAAVQGASMVGYLAGGVLLERFAPRPLVAAAGIAGLLVVAGFTGPVRRAVRRERALGAYGGAPEIDEGVDAELGATRSAAA